MTADVRTAFDAIIIGAGPAGSTAAIQLARAGWSVALVERQRFPRRKVCGECIAASNLPLLQALGIGEAVMHRAGRELRRVTLLHRLSAVSAEMPAANDDRLAWGRALGRETLDCLLLEQARASGAVVFQPWTVHAIDGKAGAWQCGLRAVESAARIQLDAAVVIDAHGSWQDLPTDRSSRRHRRNAADLLAFKANFKGTSLPEGAINVIALVGGYGGMVVADDSTMTVACCIRRDRLGALRLSEPGVGAGDAIEAWLQRECVGVRRALQGAVRVGSWVSSGPLDPGARIHTNDAIFSIGNAAGEAHPILGEGISMALQSAALLCAHLLSARGLSPVPDGPVQAEMQCRYVADWRKAFLPRLRLAALFAHVAMRPRSAALLMGLLRIWPGLLTHGARWGGKVRPIAPTNSVDRGTVST